MMTFPTETAEDICLCILTMDVIFMNDALSPPLSLPLPSVLWGEHVCPPVIDSDSITVIECLFVCLLVCSSNSHNSRGSN